MNVEAYIQSIVLKKTVETISFDRRRGFDVDGCYYESRDARGTNTPLKEEIERKMVQRILNRKIKHPLFHKEEPL
ncbi:hypothetical protein CWI37_0853p0010 [Hamiltosporidium tvaerminnensis]|uniref:Uncharacterized protein n=1 Tax=Hamiltosporidium tvaerminnensis TaxID=1176355 RepID=A0A4Q9L0S2_9MICR|nr:hypothetical protein CWI37_0853p0010 [Hamiltosporidium tvaerminnensis]